MANFLNLVTGMWGGTGAGYVWDQAGDALPTATDNATLSFLVQSSSLLDACLGLTVANGGRLQGYAGSTLLTVSGDMSVEAGGVCDGPVSIVGSLTVAATGAMNTEPTTFATAGGTAKTITTNGMTLAGVRVNNPGATSLTVVGALTVVTVDSTGLQVQNGTLTLANAVTNTFSKLVVMAGTLVDGNAATVNNVGGTLSIAAAATLTSLATWNLTASASIDNATAGNAFAVLNINDAVTATQTAAVNAAKLTGGATAVIDLAGFDLTVTTWEFDGILQASANGNLPATAALHPLAQLNIEPGVTATMTAATHATTVTGDATTTLDLAGFGLTVTNMRLLGTLNASATGNLPANTELYPLKELIVATGQTATMTGDLYVRRYAPAGTGILDLAGFDLYIIGTTPVNEAVAFANLAGTGGGRVIFKAATRAIGVVEA